MMKSPFELLGDARADLDAARGQIFCRLDGSSHPPSRVTGLTIEPSEAGVRIVNGGHPGDAGYESLEVCLPNEARFIARNLERIFGFELRSMAASPTEWAALVTEPIPLTLEEKAKLVTPELLNYIAERIPNSGAVGDLRRFAIEIAIDPKIMDKARGLVDDDIPF